MKSNIKTDSPEKNVLACLFENPTRSARDIAFELKSYRQKVWREKTKLEKGNIIWGYTAVVDEKKLNHVEYIVLLKTKPMSDSLARLIIERHFIRDMRGNLRKFSMQQFRCVACNESLRRPPLSGICPNCGGKIIFTIHEGGIKKYLELATELAEKYDLSDYIKQSLELTRRYIDSVFGKELEQQEALGKWF